MPSPHKSPDREGTEALEARLAELAEANGFGLPPSVFRSSEFLKEWQQGTEPDDILETLFKNLGIIDSASSIQAKDYLHQKWLEYQQQRKEVGDIEFEGLEFARSALITANSAYARVFADFRERVEDQRGRFFDIPLDRAESFGHYVIACALEATGA